MDALDEYGEINLKDGRNGQEWVGEWSKQSSRMLTRESKAVTSIVRLRTINMTTVTLAFKFKPSKFCAVIGTEGAGLVDANDGNYNSTAPTYVAAAEKLSQEKVQSQIDAMLRQREHIEPCRAPILIRQALQHL